MAENYGTLEGELFAYDTLEGDIDNHGEITGEIQFTGAVGGVKDVQVNNESVVDANKVAHIDLTPYAEKEDVYDKDAVNTLLEGKADTDDIPTDLADLQEDSDHRLVTDTEKEEWSGKSNVSANPQTTTETLTGLEIDGTGYAIPSGGSGDVADVKVNGTSVVDPVTKEANIDLSGYAETTDIHNPTITIQKNGQNVDTFSLNQTTNKVIDIPVPTKTSDLQNDSSFITNTVNNLANYYLKSDTYTQTEVNNLISAAVNGRFEKVTILPASGEPNVIYLVPKTTALTNNVYDEYIWQDNAWELLGSTEIDLSNYVTTTDLSTALADYVTSSTFNTTIANYYTKTEVGNLLDGKVDKVSGKGLSTYDYDATAKGIVDNVTTNLAGKVDKVNGKGLSTEDYTTTEKNKLAGISTGANKVESSTTNGNIRIDGTETQVYDGSGKVDKVNGKGLSTNDYDNTDKAKVDKINTTTTSINGNPISISGLKSNQLAKNPIITLEPIQAGSGTPSPSNIRAISGYDKVEVESCGKNVIEGWNQGSWSQAGTDSGSTTRVKSKALIDTLGNGTYVLSASTNVSGKQQKVAVMGYTYSNGTYTNVVDSGWQASGYTFTTQQGLYYGFQTSFSDNSTITPANVTGLWLEKGSTASAYEPYVKTTSISESLGQTVYGLELTVRTGEGKITRKDADLSTFTWNYNSTYQWWVAATAISGRIVESTEIYEKYEHVGYAALAGDTSKIGAFIASNGTITIRNGSNSEQPSGKIVYEPTTKAIIQLTPHEISLLKDYAYVSTNGTNIFLDYHNGELASLGDVSQLGETVNELGDYVTSPSLLNGLIHSKEITVTTNASGLANINMDSRKVCIINMFIKSNTTVHYIALVDIYQINSYIVKALNGADLTPVANQSITIVVYYYDLA